MLPKKLKENEAGTIGLPIRITILSIVGLVGFYTMLSALGSSPAPPEPMYATSNISEFSMPSQEPGKEAEANLSLLVKVLDRNNCGIEDANVVAWSPDRRKACSGITDFKGNVTIKISNPDLPPGKVEGYISIKVMRAGYRDFEDGYFVKVVQT